MQPPIQPTLPNIIGFALGISVMVLGVFTAVSILASLFRAIYRDFVSWWRLNHPPKGWQPTQHWGRKAIRRPR